MPIRRVIIVPYKMGSKSAKALKEGLVAENIRCFRKLTTSNFLPKPTDLLVYMGGTGVLGPQGIQLNQCRNIAQNKLSTLRVLTDQNIPCVEWTTDPQVARQYGSVVCRHTLTGHSGQGIEIWDALPGRELPNAPLYTKYFKRKYECRIHVFNGKVIDAQIKRKRAGTEGDTDNQVRNVHTGWVYCREGYTPDDRVKAIAIAAVAALELDFGAVDIIYNQHHNEYRVLEVNTAPGLEGTTLTNYIKEIKNVIQSHR